jgi:hypothetical protein
MGQHHKQLVLKNHHLLGIVRCINADIISVLGPDLGICTDNECSMCVVHLHHSLCAPESYQEILDIVADANKGIALLYAQYHVFASVKLKLLLLVTL